MIAVRQRLLTAQSRQKSYADVRRKDLEFAASDFVWLKISPMKGVVRFGRRGKLSPRYIGPFEILSRVGDCAYQLTLPPALSAVHNVFHVSMLRKYVLDASHVLDFTELGVTLDLTTVEWPVAIVDREERVLRNWMIPFMKVAWQYHGGDSATWECENSRRSSYPHLFGKCNLFTSYTAHFHSFSLTHVHPSLYTLLSVTCVVCLPRFTHLREFRGRNL